MISIKGLHKFFNKGRQNEIHVINDVNLELEERGMVAIFGKSGCGKTTLLNVIGGLDKFAEGTLSIDGSDIRENTDDLRNRYVGYIFQNYNLNKAESCFDNVANALRLCGISDESVIEERVNAALVNVGMEKYSKRTPDTLSGGQQQRIAIARAIVKNPCIILADEPTGNLDEANTVMIMDLLKAISKDHLVLLVTHEANLVDFYCDTVIELSDGKIVSVRSNSSANGFAARDKNAIYLGEFKKTTLSDAHADIDFYGDVPDAPIKLTIINNGGKLYVKLGTSKVQLLDETSEVHLLDGVYEERPNANSVSKSIDMSKLPRAEGTRFGRLFSVKSSIRSGYTENFKKRHKGKKLLRGCMGLFAAVIVLMTAVFGTAFGTIINTESSYNHNVFYVYAGDASVTETLNAAIGSESSGIDSLRVVSSRPNGDMNVMFRIADFETFEMMMYESNFRTNAVLFSDSLAKDLKLVEGKRDGLANEEVLITTAMADDFLEKSSFKYIREYSDLIGMISTNLSIEGKTLRVAGIVESDEKMIFLNELSMAKYSLGNNYNFKVGLASDYGVELSPGETHLIKNPGVNIGNKYPELNEIIEMRGKEFKVTKIRNVSASYEEWLENNGIKKISADEFIYNIIEKDYPNLEGYEYDDIFKSLSESKAYDYKDYYYAEYKEYAEEYVHYQYPELEMWLYVEKGIDELKYFLAGGETYYKAYKFKEIYGDYPTPDIVSVKFFDLPGSEELISKYAKMYDFEYGFKYHNSVDRNLYLVSDEDYIELSKRYGNSHETLFELDYYYYEGIAAKSVSVDVDLGYASSSKIAYAVIHSSNPKLTKTYLENEFSDITPPFDYLPAMVTPNQLRDELISDSLSTIITSIISMAIILVLMSICMYFIMRSSLMNRIKEVGIYRAIGVSKKNLVFKFTVEAAVLSTLTVFIGYVFTSAFIFICLGVSSFVSEVFFYPIWLAFTVLAVLYLLSLLCGILPILSLLRKTPSEILAKYDI